LRFPDDTAAAAARYTAGTGTLFLYTAIGPFVLRLMLEATPEGIERGIAELDEEVALSREFELTLRADKLVLPRTCQPSSPRSTPAQYVLPATR
jgi:hypothetical protein